MGAATAERRRILVVDDIELNRVLTEAVLRGATYDVDCVGDGVAAIAAVETKRYDLVLMDLDLPGLCGHDAAAAIRHGREADPQKPVKLVALSARRGVDARLRSRAVGMCGHIARPIGPQDLLREVERVFTPVSETSDPWDYQFYEDWVARLGADRMRGFLTKLLDQFKSLLSMLTAPGEPEHALRKAHDAASTGGMLGFMDVTRCCRALLEAAEALETANARAALTDALERAILRLDFHVSTQEQAFELSPETRTFDS